MSTDPHGPHRVRASDSEREEFAEIVRTAMGEGRLTLEEGEERLARVYAARFRDELPPFADDLPGGGRPAGQSPPWERGRDGDGSTAGRRFRPGMRRPAGLAALAVALMAVWALSTAHLFWPVFLLFLLWFGALRGGARRHWPRHRGPGADAGGPGCWHGGWHPGRHGGWHPEPRH
jgi:hypothetical protein